MCHPIIFITSNHIKEGKTAEFTQHYQNSIQPISDGQSDTFARVITKPKDDRPKTTSEYIQPIAVGIFGTPNPVTLEKMKKIAASGVTMRIGSSPLGGLIRHP